MTAKDAKIANRAHTSIRRRLTWLVVGSVLCSALPVAALFTFKEADRHARARWSVMKTATEVLASSVSEAVEANDQTTAFTAIRAVSRTPGIIYARVESANGGVLAETGTGARLRQDVVVSAEAGEPSLSDLILTRTIQIEAKTRGGLGKVVVVHEATDIWGTLLASLLGVFAVAGAALGAALLISRRVQNAITSPLIDLTQSVAAITTGGDFSRRVESDSRDEVGDLMRGFNAMLEAITERDAKIDAQMRGLETEVAERTRDFLMARDEANAANAAKSEFLATMSHEIRTPMNGVMVMAELLAAEPLPPKARRHAQTIAKSGRSLLAVINDILDFSKIEAGKMDTEITAVDTLELVDEVLGLFHAKAREKGLELVASAHPEAPRLVPADAVRLGQVVANLVSNALKFTERGHVLIRVNPDPDPQFWRLVVSDTGIGIATDKLSSIFSAFTQEDQTTTRRFGGTGLGLSIAKRLVEAMGGAISVTSQPGQGTQFHLRMPVDADAPRAAPPDARSRAAVVALSIEGAVERKALERRFALAGITLGTPEAADIIIADQAGREGLSDATRLVLLCDADDAQGETMVREGQAACVLPRPARHADLDQLITCLIDGMPLALKDDAAAANTIEAIYPKARVLVVDDAEVNREVACESLSRFGISAVTATDGQVALERMRAEVFDLVLMDGSMPVLDGFEATRQWRAHEAKTGLERTPIVALTAHVVGAAAEAWREAGMDGILHKPFTLAALAQVLKSALPAELAERPVAEVEAPEVRVPVTVAAPEEDLFDAAVWGALQAGKADFVSRVTGLYRTHAPEALRHLKTAFSKGDFETVAQSAHALKSMSLNLGAKAVVAITARMEQAVREDNRPVSASEVSALERTLERTLKVLNGEAAVATPAVTVRDTGTFSDEERLILRELEADLEAEALEMCYQPIFDRNGRAIVSAEALIRWDRGSRPALSPAIFIPLAERSELIHRIGAFARRRVMTDAAGWGTLPVAVNLSAVELDRPAFIKSVSDLLSETGFPPERFILEVTETAFLGEPARIKVLFERLRAMGIKLALDDFGVGYSSLTALHRYPFDKVKIDREFVVALDGEARAGLEALAIIQAVSGIGRALGMQVVAEGVETEAQHRYLMSAGVHALQGYLFSKPLSALDFEARLRAEAPFASAVF